MIVKIFSISMLDLLWFKINHNGNIYTIDYQQVLQIKVGFFVCFLSFSGEPVWVIIFKHITVSELRSLSYTFHLSPDLCWPFSSLSSLHRHHSHPKVDPLTHLFPFTSPTESTIELLPHRPKGNSAALSLTLFLPEHTPYPFLFSWRSPQMAHSSPFLLRVRNKRKTKELVL